MRSPRASGWAEKEKLRSKKSLQTTFISSRSGDASVSHTSLPVGMWKHLTEVVPSKKSKLLGFPSRGRTSRRETIVT